MAVAWGLRESAGKAVVNQIGGRPVKPTFGETQVAVDSADQDVREGTHFSSPYSQHFGATASA